MKGIVKMFKVGDYVSVDGYQGVAFGIDNVGPITKEVEEEVFYWDEDLAEDVWDLQTRDVMILNFNQVETHMVGDDTTFIFDTQEVTKIEDEDFCGGCGQIGCGW
jgi:hypothetical protein